MADQHELCELILYAEPGGELGARCAEYWAAVSAADASTSAQEYPPHVTLTGFFHRTSDHVPAAIAALHAAADAAVPAGLDGERWAEPAELEFQANDEWVGLHVQCPWMDALIAAFVADPGLAPAAVGEDELRPKSWLHVSLSYGEQFEWAREMASGLAEPFAGVTEEREWGVGLWRRTEFGWERLAGVTVRS